MAITLALYASCPVFVFETGHKSNLWLVFQVAPLCLVRKMSKESIDQWWSCQKQRDEISLAYDLQARESLGNAVIPTSNSKLWNNKTE